MKGCICMFISGYGRRICVKDRLVWTWGAWDFCIGVEYSKKGEIMALTQEFKGKRWWLVGELFEGRGKRGIRCMCMWRS